MDVDAWGSQTPPTAFWHWSPEHLAIEVSGCPEREARRTSTFKHVVGDDDQIKECWVQRVGCFSCHRL